MIGKIISHYKIEEKLGEGGMGVVYKATDLSLKRTVAIKIPHADLVGDAESKMRLQREAQAAASLTHTNICSIYEISEAEGTHFIVMEYVPGKSLAEVISRERLEMPRILDLATQIADALSEAHEKNLIHRDIKPANILVTDRGLVKITDFGLAKLTRMDARGTTVESLTKAGQIVGTVAYMAPEQARGEPMDNRSDIFSFGVVLYEMVTGKLPFGGESLFSTVDAILNKQPDPMARYNNDVPQELERILRRMLAKDAGQRYQTVKEVVIELKNVQEELKGKGGATVHISQPAQSQPAPLPKKRRWLRLGLIAGLIVVAAVSLEVWLYYFPRPVLPFSQRDWILLADFENQTGEVGFERALRQALTISLEQSSYCNVYPRERIRESLKRMTKDPERAVDESLAREICQREGIRALLLGSVNTLSGNYLLTAKIIDPGPGAVVKTVTVRAKGEKEVLDGVEELAKQIRGSLGEALNSIARSNKKLEQVTTTSLEALKFYSSGVEQNSKGKCREAILLFKTAIERDATFASAYRSLAGASRNCGNSSEARTYAAKAFELREKVTDREQFHIQALYYLIFDQYEQAIEAFKLLLNRYPDDLAGHANLGSLYSDLGQFDMGINESREALRIHPDPSKYVDIALAYLHLSNYDESSKNAAKALEDNPQNWLALAIVALDYLGKGEFEKAREQCTKMIASADLRQKLKGRERLATVLIYQGKMAEALAALQEAVVISSRNKEKSSLTQERMLMATLYDLMGNSEKAVKELDRVLELLAQAEDEYLNLLDLAVAGKFYARNGRLDKARKVVDSLAARLTGEQSNQKKVLLDFVQGEIELARKNYAAALGALQAAMTSPTQYSYFQVQESLASAYFAAGDYDKAASEYEAATKQTGWTFNYWTGLPHYSITAHYWLARADEQKGLTQPAVEHYQKFLDLWKGANENLLWLKDAKLRLKTLKAG